ncbi:hypothetical protein Stube_57230 [Streptomyces tubercidicus]|uniref:Uncharacterized protein n=1 Tax=Streptomyces tubercidicus TaxID=47759 RepID=A0A640V0X2_9ACTN|nr:hypothetical protein Stube_57230 [Streptomyces tubercidicus]
MCGTASLYVPHTGPSGPSPPVGEKVNVGGGWRPWDVSLLLREERWTTGVHSHQGFSTLQREGTGRSGWGAGRKAKQSGTPPAEVRHRTPTAPRSGTARRRRHGGTAEDAGRTQSAAKRRGSQTRGNPTRDSRVR